MTGMLYVYGDLDYLYIALEGLELLLDIKKFAKYMEK